MMPPHLVGADMRSTIILALAVLTAAPVAAQQLREARPPAELPPATYTGKQYVDSRGCVYVRAGIDDAVVWVPRVTRDRRQVCGNRPTRVAGALPAPEADAPRLIVSGNPPGAAPGAAAAPVAVPAPATAPAPGRSARVVPRHVYDAGRNAGTFRVPPGYRRVWTDDRLNPRRAEVSLTPAKRPRSSAVPAGYRQVDRGDGRLNPHRGARTAAGDARTDAIWTRTVPRRLVAVPTDRPVVAPGAAQPVYGADDADPVLVRLSTRSAPAAKRAPARSFIQVSVHADPAEARRVGRGLSRIGLPVRYGRTERRDGTFKVVLAGPFRSQGAADRALSRLRDAGFSGVRLTQ